jgi:epoxyqueuosine reductase
MNRKLLFDEIKKAAKEIGFHKVGITNAEPPLAEPHEHLNFYKKWISKGYHGEMAYLEKHLPIKSDPKKLLPSLRSIISCALSYKTEPPLADAENPSSEGALVSNYAWGDDYHEIMREKLELLVCRLRGIVPDLEARVYVDTAPLLERSLAARAGLGWIGKNSCLIDQTYGSYLFLGEILTNLDLEEDKPETDHCGSCTRCIDACPTGALVEAHTLDARRCISYLTIEKRGEFAEWEKEVIFPYLYGCDICQQVCPWNDKALIPDLVCFRPREGNQFPDLREFVSMDQKEFARRFKKSPMKRAKLDGLKRNAKTLLERGQ